MNPLKSVPGTIILGIVMSVIVMLIYKDGATNPIEYTVWFHVIVGVVWIGLLYYFNFIQVPAMADAMADSDGPGPAAIGKYVAPKALLWFRWAALLTWLSGVSAIAQSYGAGLEGGGKEAIINTFTLSGGLEVIGVGAWLGTIMLFNVWVLIWPNQKKILGLDGKSHDAAVIASAKNVALMASRINTALSIPMLLSMTAMAHGGFPM